MTHHAFFNPLEKVFRFYAGLYLAIILFQGVGLLMYIVNVWPRVRLTTSTGITVLISLAVVLGLARALMWVRIYWKGARALSILRTEGGSPALAESLVPILTTLTRMLVISCVLDFLFLPAFFLSDAFLPFSVSGWRLGAVELARLLLPQAFGFAALILAFLTHQYGILLKERSLMKAELDLTI